MGFDVLSCPWMNWGGTVSQGRYAGKAGLYGILGTLWHQPLQNSLVSYPIRSVIVNQRPDELLSAY